jgi:hypothetical protein
VGYDIFINNDGLLVTDFMNLKIKLTQSFRYVYKSMMYVCMFIGVNDHTFMRICVYIVSKKTRRIYPLGSLSGTRNVHTGDSKKLEY